MSYTNAKTSDEARMMSSEATSTRLVWRRGFDTSILVFGKFWRKISRIRNLDLIFETDFTN